MAEQENVTVEQYVQRIGSKMSLSKMSKRLGIPLRFLSVGNLIAGGLMEENQFSILSSSGYSVSRSTQARYSDGSLAAINVMREESDGAYIEPASDNIIANPSFSGAVVGVIGSGGVLPTSWDINNTAFIREVVATGTRNGRPYIRMRIARTGALPSTTSLTFRSATSAAYIAVTGPIAAYARFALVSKSGAFLNCRFGVQELNPSNTFIGNSESFIFTDVNSVEDTVWRNVPSGNKVALYVNVALSHATNDFEVVFDVEMPQIEHTSRFLSTTPMFGSSDPRTQDILNISTPRDGLKTIFSQYSSGGKFEERTISGGQFQQTPDGALNRKLQKVSVIDGSATWEQKVAFAAKRFPLVDANVANGANQRVSNEKFEVQNAGQVWSARKALNKNNMFQFETRTNDYWSGDAAQDRNRSEFKGLTNWSFGVDIWKSFSFKVLSGDPASRSYWVISQMKGVEEAGEPSSSPFLGIYIDASGYLKFTTRTTSQAIHTVNPSPTDRYVWTGLTPGQWAQIVFRCKYGWSNDAELQIWINGTEVLNLTGVSIGYNDATGPYWKFGSYSGAAMLAGASPLIVQHANMEVSTTSLLSRVTTPLDIC